MHIEHGIVTGAKLVLGTVTAVGSAAVAGKLAWDALRESGVASVAARAAMATAATFTFFQLLPHYPVGVSEVHFILGSTLFLILGAAPAAIGLAMGLLLQGLFFAPFDLPQYGMNVTTLLVPLFAVAALARRVIAPGTAYVDLTYAQALKLSTAFQGGVVAWVAFWAIYGQGVAGLSSVVTFGAAYMLVVLIEPLVDLAVLGAAKGARGLARSGLVTPRLFAAA
ncbi:energy-coupling factor ABC transporter permease [Wenxinia marina]|uniref:Cobalt uptake substrate-specific transmembrane region n=1 Tax=Wenxinia marina DSM 24838 TaxID=1123501 RepID=A0A0D0Q519_9RHOB|nr:energy-coupling factor ABC transporter permease [Wenxinia marina]KIQ67612.1 Cobalt uptake substrate-specific transmembrane region [Wenxinia marina DSM 24838]GGL68054.1 cobalt transporter [Wenxinia marina]